MRLIDKIRQMDDDELTEFLHKQIRKDLRKYPILSEMQFQSLMKFLLKEVDDELGNS